MPRILAIDPAIRHVGFAVVEGHIKAPKSLDYGTFVMPAKAPLSLCLLSIKQHIDHLIAQWQPDELAIEQIIFVQSHKTAITMGSAKAAVVIAATEAGLKIAEYTPKSVKLAVVGKGAAQKAQVAFMVRALMQLRETPDPDAADALAIAYTHLANQDPYKSSFIEKKYI